MNSKLLKIILVVFFFLFIINYLFLSNKSNNTPSYRDFEVGSEYKTKQITYAATNEENFKLMMILLQANDLDQIEKMKWSVKLVVLPKGTNVRVLDNNSDRMQVLVTNGFLNGNTVYIMWASLGNKK